jgi:hypothetical protein
MNMHWCTAKVNLSGQNLHIIHFLPTTAVSWPEVQVLSMLHGEENVYDIAPCFIADVDPGEEKRRLLGKYGMVVEQVFPGRSFRMELMMPAESRDLPAADGEGKPIKVETPAVITEPVAGGTDDPPESEPPSGAVFKPSRHPRPSAGA